MLHSEGSIPELLVPAPGPSTPSLWEGISALRELSFLAPASAPASSPSPAAAHRSMPTAGHLVLPSHAKILRRLIGGFPGAPEPSHVQMRWPIVQTPLMLPHAGLAQAAMGTPTVKQHSTQQSSLSHAHALTPQATSASWPLTLEFCRHLACPHNASVQPQMKPAPEAAEEAQPKPPAMSPQVEITQKQLVSTGSMLAHTQLLAPTPAAAGPPQLLSVALSNGQLTPLIAAKSVEAQRTAVALPEVPAATPRPAWRSEKATLAPPESQPMAPVVHATSRPVANVALLDQSDSWHSMHAAFAKSPGICAHRAG